jgi:hypothetical protein
VLGSIPVQLHDNKKPLALSTKFLVVRCHLSFVTCHLLSALHPYVSCEGLMARNHCQGLMTNDQEPGTKD